MAAAFEHNQLESFALEGVDGLIYLGDAVAGTQTAAVLRELEITLCNDFRAEDVLRETPVPRTRRPGGGRGA